MTGAFPADWPRVPFREVVEIQAGPSNIKPDLLPEGRHGVPVLSPSEIGWPTVARVASRSVSAGAAERLRRYRVRTGDLVCVRTGDLGRAAAIGPEQHGWVLGTSCLRLRPRRDVDRGYVLRYLGHPDIRGWIRENATYSTIPSLSTKVLGNLPFVIAPPEVQSMISDLLGSIEDKIAAHHELIAECERLHEWLVPYLMSGGMDLQSDRHA